MKQEAHKRLSCRYVAVQKLWKDGPLAQKMLCPAECLTVIAAPEPYTPAQWCTLSWAAVSYGGLLKGEVKAGSTLIVNGGSGSLGSVAVVLALAMGVAKVGRRLACLAALQLLHTSKPVCAEMRVSQVVRTASTSLRSRIWVTVQHDMRMPACAYKSCKMSFILRIRT